jgi:recombination protein RecT
MTDITTTTRSNPLTQFRERLLARRSELEHALEGTGIGVDRFIRTALTTAQISPDLVSDVSFQSLWLALLRACRDGLLPDGKHGAIVAFKGKAVWVPMYFGLMSRFQQSGEFKWIGADFHREDDRQFDVWIDEQGQHFIHRPGPRAGKILETYAAATTKSGGFFVTIISEQEMQRIRDFSRAKSADAPWNQWTEQMKLKTAIRRLCKVLPMPQPIEELLDRDESDTDDEPTTRVTPLRRPRTAAAVLQQFADPTDDASDGNSVGEQETPTSEPLDEKLIVRLETAYHRGKDARAQGESRKAMPPEYRDMNRTREAAAWWHGWDGNEMPDYGKDQQSRTESDG